MNNIVTFFKEVKTELIKVVWPSRQQTTKYTIVVILFTVVFSAILGLMDYGLIQVLQKVVNR